MSRLCRVFWKDGNSKALPYDNITTVEDLLVLCRKKFSFNIEQNPIEVNPKKYVLYLYTVEGDEVELRELAASDIISLIIDGAERSCNVHRILFMATTDKLPPIKKWEKVTKFTKNEVGGLGLPKVRTENTNPTQLAPINKTLQTTQPISIKSSFSTITPSSLNPIKPIAFTAPVRDARFTIDQPDLSLINGFSPKQRPFNRTQTSAFDFRSTPSVQFPNPPARPPVPSSAPKLSDGLPLSPNVPGSPLSVKINPPNYLGHRKEDDPFEDDRILFVSLLRKLAQLKKENPNSRELGSLQSSVKVIRDQLARNEGNWVLSR